MQNKSFDKDLFDTYDKMGRDIVKSFVGQWGMIAEDNPDKYGVDLLLYSDAGLVACAEVEVRNSWKTVEFPYEDLNVPHRKKKLLENNELDTWFFSINASGSALFFCKGEDVLDSDVKESRNKYVYKGEHFFKVPLDKLTHVVLCP